MVCTGRIIFIKVRIEESDKKHTKLKERKAIKLAAMESKQLY